MTVVLKVSHYGYEYVVENLCKSFNINFGELEDGDVVYDLEGFKHLVVSGYGTSVYTEGIDSFKICAPTFPLMLVDVFESTRNLQINGFKKDKSPCGRVYLYNGDVLEKYRYVRL